MGKKLLKAVLCIFLALIFLGGSYIGFMIATDYKPEEKITLDIENTTEKKLKANENISISTFNIGYGTMDNTVDFFMDGGKMSRGVSKERTLENMNGIIDILKNLNSDILFLQEVDVKATRSYKVNELQLLKDTFSDYGNTFAINYKVPWVPIPIYKPHGQVLAGLTTFSRYNIESAVRYDLPGKSSFFVQLGDLDRAMAVHRIRVENGKSLWPLMHIYLLMIKVD